jgi:hypothetical protein
MALVGAGQAASAGPPDVVGETYGKATAILKNQGYKVTFGGSIGSDLPQVQCLVIDQSSMTNDSQRLRLDCTLQPGQEMPGAPNTHSLVPPGGSVPGATGGSGGSRPTPGAGTVTVVPVPVG